MDTSLRQAFHLGFCALGLQNSESRVQPGMRISLFCSGVCGLPNPEQREHPSFRLERRDPNRGKGLVAAALAPSPPGGSLSC